jgi:hypothetical protein
MVLRAILSALSICAIFLALSGELQAGEGRTALRAQNGSGNGGSRGLVAGGRAKHTHRHPGGRPIYPYTYYYRTYVPPVLVVSPYGGSYYLPPTVVVTQPYFCVLHNEGFVSRVGLLDHLSSSLHRIPLDAAAAICPDGVESCVFPTY